MRFSKLYPFGLLPTVVVVLSLSLTHTAHAQFRASLTGTVTDPQGATVPGAQVTLTDTDTNRVLKAVSNENGVYSFNALPPDHFTLVTTMNGFTTSTLKNVTVVPEQPNNIDVKLQVSKNETTVDVNADSIPSLETSTASTSGTVTSDQIQHLPSAGRDVFQLAQLAPGGFGDGSQAAGGGSNNLPGSQGPGGSAGSTGIFATENGPQTLAGGGQYETNGVTIDGISTTSAVWGGTTIITPNEDSVDSLKITTNGYDAENGRFSGAQMAVTTKSGTNQFHGSFFFRANRPGLNAYQRYNGPGSLVAGTPQQRGLLRDTDRFNQIGGSVGGPIWEDRLFAFFAYETLRNNTQATANAWYETPAFDALQGGAIANQYLTFAGHAPVGTSLISETCSTAGLVEGTNCRTIPGQGLDVGSPLKNGTSKQDLSWVSTQNPGVGSGLDGVADVAHYQTSSPKQVTGTQYNGRLDANVTQKDHLAFAIYWVPFSQTSFLGPARSYNLWNHNQINQAFSVIWNHTFSPTFLNEARANAAGWRFNELGTNPQAPFGLPTNTIGATGSFTLQNFGGQGPSNYNQWTYSYKDVATKILGNHTIKFGGDLTRLYYLQDALPNARPSYLFFNIWTFLNDAPQEEDGTFDRFTGVPTSNRFDTRENIWGGFVQDDWKVRPNLTFNMGLHYAYFDSLYAKQNNLPNLNFGTGSSTFTGMSIQIGGHTWKPQKGNFGPQFGFAWSPAMFNSKMVVRGGYGLNYNQTEIALSSNEAFNPGASVTAKYVSPNPSSINPNIIYSVPGGANNFYGYPANPHAITSYNSANLPNATDLTVNAIPNNLHTAYTHHYSLDTQFDLGKQFVATVGYQGTAAHRLLRNENLYIYGLARGYAVNPQINFINYFGDSNASSYNALLAGVRHSMAHHLQFNADFTWSKSMDGGSGPYERDPYPYNGSYAWGRSDFNFGKALKVYGVWQPVFFHGNHAWLEKIAGGWAISGIYNYHGGFPWTPTVNVGTNAYYSESQYGTFRPSAYNGRAKMDQSNNSFKRAADGYSPNFTGGGRTYFASPTVTTSSFPVPGIARNSFNGPRYQDLDATITKSFGLPKAPVLGENARIEFRADAFNVLNLTALDISKISTDITATDFGVIKNALGSRVINLQARFSF